MAKYTVDSEKPIVSIKNLNISFGSGKKEVKAVKDVNLDIYPGETVAIVGESGSGKSTTAHAIIGLLPSGGKVTSGTIEYLGYDLTKFSEKRMLDVRGDEIGLVPQDPMSNLNPVLTIGYQVKETLQANNVDYKREKRYAADSAENDKQEDEVFLSSSELEQLFEVTKQEISKQNLTDEQREEITKYFDNIFVPGSATKRNVRDALKNRGVEKYQEIADQYVQGKASLNDRIVGLLDEAGLGKMAERIKLYPHEFSGGMKQRVLIAIALAARPKLLIADEPTSALDVTVQQKILDNLAKMTNSLGTTVLMITHDLGLALERSDYIVIMYKGHIVEQGSTKDILQNRQHPYTKRLLQAAPSIGSVRMVHEKSEGDSNATTSRADLHTDQKEEDELKKHIIVAENLTRKFWVRGGKNKEAFTAVDNVSFSLVRGRSLGIVGESGSGKSTVANMLLRLIRPTSGKLYYNGTDLSNLSPEETLKFRRRVQPVFQNPYGSLDPMYSIYSSIIEPMKIHKIGDKKFMVARARELMDLVQLPQSMLSRYPNELSGGQRQRVAIARALALEPSVLICDEAVSALDVIVQDQILQLLNGLQSELNVGMIFITHDLAVIKQVADDVLVMQHGKLVEGAPTEKLFANPEAQYTRDLLNAIPGGQLLLQ